MNTQSNMLCLNDWEIWRFLQVVVATQLIVLAFLAIDPTPGLLDLSRALLGFIYIAVIPGAVLLRILRLHDLGTAKTLVSTICLSLFFAMLLGFIANASYPSLGITARPLSSWSIAVTFAVALSLLSTVAYYSDRNYRHRRHLIPTSVPFLLLFFSLPLIAVLGAELVNHSDDNTVLMILLPVLALIPVIAVRSGRIPENLYPWVIFTIAVSVLLHVSYISTNLAGLDTQIEFRIFELAEAGSAWSSTAPANTYNSTLSVTILPVVISRLTGLAGLPIFKTVFPILLGLVPLAMYTVLRQYINRDWALLAVLLLVFQYAFYFTVPLAAKQLIGWVFMAALVLAITSRPGIGMNLLRVVFLLALVVSHYATAFLTVVLLALAVPILIWQHRGNQSISVNLGALAVAATIGWYLYSADSTTFDTFTVLGSGFMESLLSGFADPGGHYATGLISRTELSPTRLLLKFTYIALQGFIAVGMVTYLWRWIRKKRVEFPAEFMALSVASFVLFTGTIGIPYLASFTDINRLFALPMFFLAPFAIAGLATIIDVARKISIPGVTRSSEEALNPSQPSSVGDVGPGFTPQHTGVGSIALTVGAVFVATFFLLSSGFVSEIVGEKHPLSFAVSGDRMHAPVQSEQDLRGAEWLVTTQQQPVEFYHDFFSWPVYIRLGPHNDTSGLYFGMLTVTAGKNPVAAKEIPPNSYVIFTDINVKTEELVLGQFISNILSGPRITPLEELPPHYYEAIVGGDVIYDNGEGWVIRSP